MREYAAYLFDADGTLIDTTDLIYHCFVYTCKRFGGHIASQEEVISHIGLPLRTQLEEYFGKMDAARFELLSQAHMEHQLQIYPSYLRLFEDVQPTLEWLRLHEKKLAVVSSRRLPSLQKYLAVTGIADYFTELITPEATTRHKPDPAPALHALSLLQVDSRETLLVGDSPFDIRCGSGAGIDTAYICRPHNTGSQDNTTEPTCQLTTLQELCTST